MGCAAARQCGARAQPVRRIPATQLRLPAGEQHSAPAASDTRGRAARAGPQACRPRSPRRGQRVPAARRPALHHPAAAAAGTSEWRLDGVHAHAGVKKEQQAGATFRGDGARRCGRLHHGGLLRRARRKSASARGRLAGVRRSWPVVRRAAAAPAHRPPSTPASDSGGSGHVGACAPAASASAAACTVAASATGSSARGCPSHRLVGGGPHGRWRSICSGRGRHRRRLVAVQGRLEPELQEHLQHATSALRLRGARAMRRAHHGHAAAPRHRPAATQCRPPMTEPRGAVRGPAVRALHAPAFASPRQTVQHLQVAAAHTSNWQLAAAPEPTSRGAPCSSPPTVTLRRLGLRSACAVSS